MKFAKGLVAGIAAMSMALSAQAGGSVGLKLWYASFNDSTVADDTLMIGPTLSFGGDTVWVSAMAVVGSTKMYDEDFMMADGEAVLGYTFGILDIGIGGRYTTWTIGNEIDLQIWGPMAYTALASSFGESPVGWYVGASYMFLDLGNAEDYATNGGYGDKLDTFEHANAEAGVSFNVKHFQATLGYRLKYYLNYNDADKTDNLTHSGVAASASFVF